MTTAAAFVVIAIVSVALPSVAPAQEARTSVSLDHGWRFKQSADLTGVEGGTFDDSGWTAVDVPHTWNRLGNTGTERSPLSNTVQGVGWYRLKFATPAAAVRGKRYFLQFDGVGTIAEVWLNGHYLGKHAGAFARFRFDATSAMVPAGGENLLAVKADNSRPQPGATTENVIPLSGDFFVFGGIYRNVSLVVTDPVHVDMLDFGGPGVYARATSITREVAAVQVTSRLTNDGAKSATVQVETHIEDAAGNVVVSDTRARTLHAGLSDSSTPRGTGADASRAAGDTVVTLQVPKPHLWQGTRDPYLYRTVVTLRTGKGTVLDRLTQPLGLRTLAFDPNKGFFLNGEHVFLHGASMHQDRPVKGWAISAADQEQDLEYLLDMGGNAVRFAHYQHDQRSYEVADERGIIAWAEIPLVNQVSFDGTPANEALSANAKQQLMELIRQNFNHPSIAVWSIANEVDLRQKQASGPAKARVLLESLNRLAKTADPGRFTTLADCCEAQPPRDSVVGITDVVGYNRYFGWYLGNFGQFGPMLDAAHERHPNVPIAVSEYGAGAALTQHTDDPAGVPIDSHGRPHPEEYQDLYHEESWKTLRTRPYLWGVFIWNMFDFSSDSRKEGDLTDMNDKGLVNYDRTVAKDAFYFYRANWSIQPTLHLVGRRYTDRAQAVLDIKAYSNAAQAQLTLNGSDQGTTRCEQGICIWRGIHLRPGENDVRATATIGTATERSPRQSPAGVQVTDSLQWRLVAPTADTW